MSTTNRGSWRQYAVAIRAMIVLTIVLGVMYPLAITVLGQVALPSQAHGSLIERNGQVVGSSLIGQSFTDPDGTALPQWFQSRPSAAGKGYEAGASGGSNYGPENPDLLKAIAQRKKAVSQLDRTDPGRIPVDALTASASGLDPHISPAYALEQVRRVARAHGLDEATVRTLVESRIQGRDLGYLGESTVNVLELNLALAELDH
ncbi:potassium-transporting ATPase subunit KdpC [Glaciibacter flavus]|uniref:Potassium-transporting ATPase KdpC subunit n=1 Tax=Orlajensenia flava TaxID=2565934 RepID=A0A4V3WUA8_9MICO|nr:potassium-transporting ATPase subunit KdpC [Glaciibacter flavus]THG35127.1 potassium-transporting ATPase subunit KdpC [Glaciibacter flavus]